MLEQLYATFKEQLMAVEGMVSQPYQAKTGNAPTGGIDEFILRGKHFAGLRLTDKYVMLYVGPLLEQNDLENRYSQQLTAIRSGKGCLKITKPEKTDITPVLALLAEGAASWK